MLILKATVPGLTLFLTFLSLLWPSEILAWDEHSNLTRAALQGARATDPALHSVLERTRLQVRPLSAFLSKYYPLSGMRARTGNLERIQLEPLLRDVGPDYRVQYTSQYQATEIILDWSKGWSAVAYRFDDTKISGSK